MRNPVPAVSSRQIGASDRREHILTLEGVELRVQMHPFSQEEIDDAVRLYLTTGETTPRHCCTRWGDQYSSPKRKLPGGATLTDPIVYDGLRIED